MMIVKCLTLCLLLLVLSCAAWGAPRLVNLGSTATAAVAVTGMTADGQYVAFHQSSLIQLADAGTRWNVGSNSTAQIGFGSSAGVAYQSGNVVAAGQCNTLNPGFSASGPGKYVGGVWTPLPVASGYTATKWAGKTYTWTAKSIAATSTQIFIGGQAGAAPISDSCTTTATATAPVAYTDSTSSARLIPEPALYAHNTGVMVNSSVSENGIYATRITCNTASSPPYNLAGNGAKGGAIGTSAGLIFPLYIYGAPNQTCESWCSGINRPGTRVVGQSSTAGDTWWRPAYWDGPFTTATACHELPTPGYNQGECQVVSDDCKVMAGFAANDTWANQGAYIWTTAPGGTISGQFLSTFATSKGIDCTGWTFQNVTGISADGNVLCGTGLYGGLTRGWVLSTVPEPGSLSVLAIGLVGLLIRKRKS